MTFGSRLGALGLALALVGGAGACTSDAGSDASPTSTTDATTTTTEVPLALPPAVLNPGRAPRQELRFALEEGDEVVLRYATDVAIDQEFDGRRQRLDSPPIVQLVRLTVTAVDGDEAELAMATESVTVDARDTDLTDEQVAELQASLDPLTGVTGTIRVDELGRTLAAELDVPDDLPAAVAQSVVQLEDQLRQLTPSLPEQPVGVGAEWVSRSDASGVPGAGSGEIVRTLRVVAIDGDRVTYEATNELDGGPQELDLGDGTEATVVSSQMTGTSEGWFELGSPAQELDASTESTMALTVGDDETPVDQRTSIRVRIAPQAP